MIDVAIVGGGIVGCAAAAFLAEAGASVELFERGELASGASGRNQGSVQHPFDELLGPLHEETLAIYRELEGFEMPAEPVGVLLLSRGGELPLSGSELAALEPSLAPGLSALREETGYPVRPASATLAFAERARAAGARLHEGVAARLEPRGERAAGVATDGGSTPAGSVLVAAGPCTSELVDPRGGWRPVEPLWGVLAELELETPPRHVLEEADVKRAASGQLASMFSLVPSAGACAVGSTFDSHEPDAAKRAPALVRAGEAFVPALATARLRGARACARPLSADGRPLLGPVPGIEGLHVAAGHGPWGISVGPGSARLAADALLGRAEVPEPLAAARFG